LILGLTLRREAAHIVPLTFLPENEGVGFAEINKLAPNLSMKPKASSKKEFEFDFKEDELYLR
jgi:hypothetical protein